MHSFILFSSHTVFSLMRALYLPPPPPPLSLRLRLQGRNKWLCWHTERLSVKIARGDLGLRAQISSLFPVALHPVSQALPFLFFFVLPFFVRKSAVSANSPKSQMSCNDNIALTADQVREGF